MGFMSMMVGVMLDDERLMLDSELDELLRELRNDPLQELPSESFLKRYETSQNKLYTSTKYHQTNSSEIEQNYHCFISYLCLSSGERGDLGDLGDRRDGEWGPRGPGEPNTASTELCDGRRPCCEPDDSESVKATGWCVWTGSDPLAPPLQPPLGSSSSPTTQLVSSTSFFSTVVVWSGVGEGDFVSMVRCWMSS